MLESNSEFSKEHVVTIARSDRWQVYQRLRDLEILCSCSEDGRLRVEVSTIAELLQLRSVIRQLTAPRSELVNWLEQCWQQA